MISDEELDHLEALQAFSEGWSAYDPDGFEPPRISGEGTAVDGPMPLEPGAERAPPF